MVVVIFCVCSVNSPSRRSLKFVWCVCVTLGVRLNGMDLGAISEYLLIPEFEPD